MPILFWTGGLCHSRPPRRGFADDTAETARRLPATTDNGEVSATKEANTDTGEWHTGDDRKTRSSLVTLLIFVQQEQSC